MRPITSIIVLVAFCSPLTVSGGESVTHDSSVHGHHQGYSGLQQREVASLSEEELADLRAGRGMGLALPAELNGYPGPRHVLDLADELELTDEQIERTRELLEHMQREAIAAGERYIERERAVDTLFAERQASVGDVDAATRAAADAQGELRAIHLRYHVKVAELLTRHQLHEYQKARGYSGDGGHDHRH